MSGVETELGQTDDDDATDLTAEAETDRPTATNWRDTQQWSFCLGLCAGLLFPPSPSAALDPWTGEPRGVAIREFLEP